jgi:hypothetical protein
MPIRYFVTDRGVGGVSSTQFQQAVSRAFATWDGVSRAQISSTFAGFTLSNPSQGDGATVIGFQNRPDLDRTLGGDVVPDRYDRRFDCRGRCLPQHRVPVVCGIGR